VPAATSKSKTWLGLVGALVIAMAAAIFWQWPKIHARLTAVSTTLEGNSQVTATQHKDAKASDSHAGIPSPHELAIPDVAAYTWFEPNTKQALVWYSSSADGSFRFFDGPGVDPQTGKELSPVTSEFVGSLRRQQTVVPSAPKPKAQTPVPSKEKEAQVSDSTTDSLQQDAQLEAMAQEAQTSLNAGDYRAALDICGKVLSASAGSQPCTAIRQHASIKLAEQFVNEGTVYWEKGEFDKALQSAEKAIDLDPANQNAVKLKQLALHMKVLTPK
jgi:hypothetical protein